MPYMLLRCRASAAAAVLPYAAAAIVADVYADAIYADMLRRFHFFAAAMPLRADAFRRRRRRRAALLSRRERHAICCHVVMLLCYTIYAPARYCYAAMRAAY